MHSLKVKSTPLVSSVAQHSSPCCSEDWSLRVCWASHSLRSRRQRQRQSKDNTTQHDAEITGVLTATLNHLQQDIKLILQLKWLHGGAKCCATCLLYSTYQKVQEPTVNSHQNIKYLFSARTEGWRHAHAWCCENKQIQDDQAADDVRGQSQH